MIHNNGVGSFGRTALGQTTGSICLGGGRGEGEGERQETLFLNE